MTLRLEDGRVLDMRKDDPRLRHVDRAWASTIHAFQGRTVDTVIAALEAVEPELAKGREAGLEADRSADRERDGSASRQPERTPGRDMEKARRLMGVDRDLGLQACCDCGPDHSLAAGE